MDGALAIQIVKRVLLFDEQNNLSNRQLKISKLQNIHKERIVRKVGFYSLERSKIYLIILGENFMALYFSHFSLIFLGTFLALSIVKAEVKSDSLSSEETQTLVTIPNKPQAPNFTLTDMRNKTHTLSDYQGKIVIVNFWAVWCAPCRKEMPSMQRAWEEIRNKDVHIMAINWGDNVESIDDFLKSIDIDLEFPILIVNETKKITSDWSVKGLPTTFVIDPKGRLAYKVMGDIEWDNPKILGKILKLRN